MHAIEPVARDVCMRKAYTGSGSGKGTEMYAEHFFPVYGVCLFGTKELNSVRNLGDDETTQSEVRCFKRLYRRCFALCFVPSLLFVLVG